MSTYKLVGLNCGNMDRWPYWNLVTTISLPNGSFDVDYPSVPDHVEEMTLSQLKAYVLMEYRKKKS